MPRKIQRLVADALTDPVTITVRGMQTCFAVHVQTMCCFRDNCREALPHVQYTANAGRWLSTDYYLVLA